MRARDIGIGFRTRTDGTGGPDHAHGSQDQRRFVCATQRWESTMSTGLLMDQICNELGSSTAHSLSYCPEVGRA